MNIWVVRASITDLAVDAIVNAANPWLIPEGGVAGDIHRAAGPRLGVCCEQLHGCPVGSAVSTPGCNLQAQYVIHAVGPDCRDVKDPEEQVTLLRSAYTSALSVACDLKVRSIAFPAISTGLYRFPMRLACMIAVGVVRDWVMDYPQDVYFVAFTEEMEQAYYKALEE